jgi:hypothetical protein
MRDDDLPGDVAPADQASLVALSQKLAHVRPVPAASFRASLRARLIREPRFARPAHLWRVSGAFAASGAMLIAVAAAGLMQTGPLGP